MPTPPQLVKSQKFRTLGSNTTMVEEWQVSYWPYHVGRGVRWCYRNPGWTALAALPVALVIVVGLSLQLALIAYVGIVSAAIRGWAKRNLPQGTTFAQTVALMWRSKELKKQWKSACVELHLTGQGRQLHPQLQGLRGIEGGGFTATIDAGKAVVTVSKIRKAANDLAELLGCTQVTVTTLSPGKARIDFYWTDALDKMLPLARMPIAAPGRVAYGVRRDGSPASFPRNQSVLFGGKSRHGKSTLVHASLADLVRQRIHVDVWISDPKSGMELSAYEPRVGQNTGPFQVVAYSPNPEDSVTMIAMFEEKMRERQAIFKARGIRVHVPSEEFPLQVIVIDELLPFTKMLKEGAASLLGKVLYQGAAAGFVVWANSQLGEKAVLGQIRDLIQCRVCVATPNWHVSDAILGDGAYSNDGVDGSVLQGKPGRVWSFEDGDMTASYREGRGAMVTDADIIKIARGQVPDDMAVAPGPVPWKLYRVRDVNRKLLWVGLDDGSDQEWFDDESAEFDQPELLMGMSEQDAKKVLEKARAKEQPKYAPPPSPTVLDALGVKIETLVQAVTSRFRKAA